MSEAPKNVFVKMTKDDDLVKRLRLGACALEIEQAADRIEALEAKLAKAVKALDRIAGKAPYADDPYDIARAALAELTGNKP